MVARTWGTISPAAMPWATRAAISMPMLPARLHQAEARVNPSTPARNTRLRPARSPSRPPVTSSRPKGRV